MKRNLSVMKAAATLVAALVTVLAIGTGQAQTVTCANLPVTFNGTTGILTWDTLKSALVLAVSQESSGLKNHMWATVVDRDGNICAVAYSGANRGAQWPGSRVISAQKANAANAFSLDPSSFSNGSGQPGGLALSTANLYAAVQPGGSLYGLEVSNPVNPAVAYAGSSGSYGTPTDPLVGLKLGGVNVFGGGLALYGTVHQVEGGLGVSGDTSCTDHNVAWRLRHILGLDHMAGGIGSAAGLSAVAGPASLYASDPTHPDNIIFDITGGVSASGFGHPECPNASGSSSLPPVQP